MRKTVHVAVIALLPWVLSGCASASEVPDDASLSDVLVLLEGREADGYEGGLTRGDVAIADALAEAAFESGIARHECEPYNPASGQIISDQSDSESPRIDDENPVFGYLAEFILDGNRRQRDIVLLAIVRVGPGAPVNQSYLQRNATDSPWLNEAMSATTCRNWAPANLRTTWSPERQEKFEAMTRLERREASLDFAIDRMLRKELVYPPGVFEEALHNAGLKYELTLEDVRRLLPILEDDGYPVAIRTEAIGFVSALGSHPEVFEDALLDLYNSGVGDLGRRAGFALVEIGSRSGADVLADILESGEYRHWAWSPGRNCEYPPANDRLITLLTENLQSDVTSFRVTAAEALGCIGERSAVPELLDVLDMPYWSQKIAILEALGRIGDLPDNAMAEMTRLRDEHWSSLVRDAARAAIEDSESGRPEQEEEGGARELTARAFECFHRCAIDHGLPLCHGEKPGDGLYDLPWLENFQVNWVDAKVHDLPDGFPVEVPEMEGREGYGTNTFYRVENGWLFSVDLWHYDGDFGVVTDDGRLERFGPETINAAFIIETDFGITALAQDTFEGGRGGVLAVLRQGEDGDWRYERQLELPGEAFGYAFAPDGTLLVKDGYGAVAVTREKEIYPLECAGSE